MFLLWDDVLLSSRMYSFRYTWGMVSKKISSLDSDSLSLFLLSLENTALLIQAYRVFKSPSIIFLAKSIPLFLEFEKNEALNLLGMHLTSLFMCLWIALFEGYRVIPWRITPRSQLLCGMQEQAFYTALDDPCVCPSAFIIIFLYIREFLTWWGFTQVYEYHTQTQRNNFPWLFNLGMVES